MAEEKDPFPTPFPIQPLVPSPPKKKKIIAKASSIVLISSVKADKRRKCF